MKKYVLTILIFLLACEESATNNNDDQSSSDLQQFPVSLRGASTTIWNDTVYLFGGSYNFNNSNVIWKLTGNKWIKHDTIPDNFTFEGTLVLDHDVVYYLNGYAWNETRDSLRFRKYNFLSKKWIYLASPLHTGYPPDYHASAAELNESFIYMFFRSGGLHKYDIQANSWAYAGGSPIVEVRSCPSVYLNSVNLDGKFYISGSGNGVIYEFTPKTNSWSEIAKLDSITTSISMEYLDNSLWLFGGNKYGKNTETLNSIYSVSINDKSITQTSDTLKYARASMASYVKDNKIHLIGGLGYPNNDDIVDLGTNIIETFKVKN